MSKPSDKVLVIRKPDATIHVVEISNRAALLQYNNKLKAADKWKFETMNRDKAEALPHIDPNFISPAKAVAKIDELQDVVSKKDDEIALLKQQLADAANAGGAGGAKIYNLNVKDMVAKIKEAKDATELQAIVGDDDRKGVLDAAEKQAATFK